MFHVKRHVKRTDFKRRVMMPTKILAMGAFIFFVFMLLATVSKAVTLPTLTTTVTTTPLTANWVALPPYNTLWPLWSPVLSPDSQVTGLPAPLVTSLTRSTVLPVQPGLTWHFGVSHPWMLYNTPMGMAYYDPLYGINLWPPSILMNSITGLPITLTLPVGYETLPATQPWWNFYTLVGTANSQYLISYPNFTGLPGTIPTVLPSTGSLLTATALLY